MAREVALVAQRCEEAKESLDLNLEQCDLKRIPPAIFTVLNPFPLKAANFSRNFLTRVSNNIHSFSNLRELDVSFNSISDLPVEITHLLLQKINISNNRFTSLPQTLFSISSLEHINAKDNKITTIDSKEFEKLEHLKELELEGNEIDTSISHSILSQLSLPFLHRRF